MNRPETLALLSQHKPEMQRRFGVRTLALFGSRAREQSHANSDIDVLVEFDGPATSARYFRSCETTRHRSHPGNEGRKARALHR